MNSIELLAPARDINCGIAAINAGADAVYIGGPSFGAREDASNSIEDIERVASYALIFSAKLFVTLNTILFEHEIEKAHALAWELYRAGADAFIVQDMAFMEMEMPPIPLHASTQTNNYDIDRIKFLSRSGFKRIVLARELTLEQVKEIRAATDTELECFIHGALCVSLSGQCYMSHAVGRRSANRGACAQPCRHKYSLTDDKGKVIMKDKHLLCLKDLSLSDYLDELIDVGVSSLKIEGRLKDVDYVKNVTGWYRQQIDKLLEKRPSTRRASFGTSTMGFTPDPAKSFNRGFTDYFLHGRQKEILSPDTPKSLGTTIGIVSSISHNSLTIKTKERLSNNDGLLFIDKDGETRGIKVNNAEGDKIVPDAMNGVFVGATLFRNYDHLFVQTLKRAVTERRLGVDIRLSCSTTGVTMEVETEAGETFKRDFNTPLIVAENKDKSKQLIINQLSKSGQTPFKVTAVETGGVENYFFRASTLNEMRRELLDSLRELLEKRRTAVDTTPRKVVDYPEKELGFEANVSNSLSHKFYTSRGVEKIDNAFELREDTTDKRVMTTKHCLRYYAGLCPKRERHQKSPSSMYLIDENGRKYKLTFNCRECFMECYTSCVSPTCS